jgi:hypothetical protein
MDIPSLVQDVYVVIPFTGFYHFFTMTLKKILLYILINPFWDSKPELFSDIACLRIPYQPWIVLFGNFFSGTPASNRRELRLHLNVVPTGAGVFKSRHILLHKYVNRIMITYL